MSGLPAGEFPAERDKEENIEGLEMHGGKLTLAFLLILSLATAGCVEASLEDVGTIDSAVTGSETEADSEGLSTATEAAETERAEFVRPRDPEGTPASARPAEVQIRTECSRDDERCVRERLCGSRGLAACGDDQYCNWEGDACGSADVAGVCEDRPTACPEHIDPVCGCDRETYFNACEAATAGVDVSHDGACEGEAGDACGSWFLGACAEGLHCDWEYDSCGAADRPGVCVENPEICTREYAPVCGCDGETYSNRCVAASNGVDAVHEGACAGEEGAACGGRVMTPCDDGLYCNWDPDSCGHADQQGRCEVVPEACTKQYEPVCGCDGETYGNRCMATLEGSIDVAFEGTCEVPDGAEGDPCGSRGLAECQEGLFCDWEANSCGADDRPGVCVVIPPPCRAMVDPVCGCDNETYDNFCTAHSEGVDVAYEGSCEEPVGEEGDLCGSRGLNPCGDGLFCDWARNSCGATDIPGVCTVIPNRCRAMVDPVCGCDNETYENFCTAHSEGVDVAYEGSCDEPVGDVGDACGSRGLNPCGDGLYCDWARNSCGATDVPGTCQFEPVLCTREYAPVCGCDGETHGNTCMAASVGVDVAYRGECRTR